MTANKLLAQIKRKYRREIAQLNGHLFDDSGDRMLFRSRKVEDWNTPGIMVRSLLDRHTTLTIMNRDESIDDLDPHAPALPMQDPAAATTPKYAAPSPNSASSAPSSTDSPRSVTRTPSSTSTPPIRRILVHCRGTRYSRLSAPA
ncbi:hypothetical protein [Rhodococcus oxybenzonivorans]|uniref:hypothetical protein n=1 Tax=Rhodococcus oxybenzonivorans TaxID=1990687 RepID=UPI001E50AF54|nr:hypothetical protein [Rhodococcus oxybenzonivorans]